MNDPATKPTMGRPPLPPGQVASAQVGVRIPAPVKNSWVKAAKKRGETLSEFVIAAANERAARPPA